MSEDPVQKRPSVVSIRAVVFDYGEVLCHPPTTQDMERMAAVLGIPTEIFRVLYSDRGRYDRGDVTAAEYWSKVASGAGVRVNDKTLEQLRDWDVQMWSSIDESMLDWIGELRSLGLKTAILSNMHSDMVAHVRRDFKWLSNFDCLVLSSEIHLIKPEPAIYQHCLRCLGVAPQEVLFLDDRGANVRGAQAAGWNAIRVHSRTQLIQELEALPFTPLPRASTQCVAWLRLAASRCQKS
jgi:putative hydrolase of the HAD superfamily